MKRSPLARKTPLSPGRKSLKRTRLAERGARSRRDEPALKLFREAIYKRCGCNALRVGVCENCRTRAVIDPHHLVGRARAPGWRFLHDPAINGLGCCTDCHRDFTAYPHLAGKPFGKAWAIWKRDRAHSSERKQG